MARTVEEYKSFIEDNFWYLGQLEGWENLVDNIINYDGIDYPDESERGTVYYDRKNREAEHKWEVEEEKVVEALTQYLQDTIGEYTNGRAINTPTPTVYSNGTANGRADGTLLIADLLDLHGAGLHDGCVFHIATQLADVVAVAALGVRHGAGGADGESQCNSTEHARSKIVETHDDFPVE